VARQRAQLIAAAFQALTLIITVTGCAALPVQATQDGRDTPAAQRGSADSGEPGSATSPTMSAASQSLLQQSRSQQRAGDYPQAAATLERALRVDPSQPVLMAGTGTRPIARGPICASGAAGSKGVIDQRRKSRNRVGRTGSHFSCAARARPHGGSQLDPE
jgi:hypothetical protein